MTIAMPHDTFTAALCRTPPDILAVNIALLEETRTLRLLQETAEHSARQLTADCARAGRWAGRRKAVRRVALVTTDAHDRGRDRLRHSQPRFSRRLDQAEAALENGLKGSAKLARIGWTSLGDRYAPLRAGDALNRVSRRAEELTKLPTGELRALLIRELSERARLSAPETVDAAWYRKVLEAAGRSVGVRSEGVADAALAERTTTELLVTFAKALERALDDLTPEEEAQLLDHVIEALRRLPDDVLADALTAMEIEELSRENLHAALRSGAVTGALVGAAGFLGFKLFLFAATMLKAVALLVMGKALPFAAFVGLSKVLALIVHHPLVLMAAAVGVSIVGAAKRTEIDGRMIGLALLTVLSQQPPPGDMVASGT